MLYEVITAHEVRNPLGVLTAHLKILERSGADPATTAAILAKTAISGASPSGTGMHTVSSWAVITSYSIHYTKLYDSYLLSVVTGGFLTLSIAALLAWFLAGIGTVGAYRNNFV